MPFAYNKTSIRRPNADKILMFLKVVHFNIITYVIFLHFDLPSQDDMSFHIPRAIWGKLWDSQHRLEIETLSWPTSFGNILISVRIAIRAVMPITITKMIWTVSALVEMHTSNLLLSFSWHIISNPNPDSLCIVSGQTGTGAETRTRRSSHLVGNVLPMKKCFSY